ncbi:MAG: hypothetical protein GF331_12130, partial [Chitinivibrionales bacterium]|nr:hypothetical protein [Chitinivibrionales bacterium]
SVPSGYAADDIRLYQLRSDGSWEVYHEYEHDASRRMVIIEENFLEVDSVILMIDTQPPSVTLQTNIDDPVVAQTDLSYTVDVSDNVAVLDIVLEYARGEDSTESHPTGINYDTAAGTITATVLGTYVTNDNGPRVYLSVSDGRHTHTLDLSRQVSRDEASDILTTAGQWVPLRTTAILDNDALAPVIDGVTGGGYNNTVCRVYRYFDPNATTDYSNGPHAWVEYSAAKPDVFALEPGKLMWTKTSGSPRLSFGSGVTVSLRDTFELRLPAGRWTDFALPYRFDMCVGDIVAATGPVADTLELYSWELEGSRYVAQPLYFGTLPGDTLNRLSSILSFRSDDGYTIRNPAGHDVTLRIPPTNSLMSSYRTLARRLSKERSPNGEWALIASARLSDGARVTDVVMGYAPDEHQTTPTWYGAAPSFARAGIRAFDPMSSKAHGHVVAHASPSENGVRFTLELYNDLDRAERMTVRLCGMSALPEGWRATFVDGIGGEMAPAEQGVTVTVPARQRAYRTVAVGGPGFALTALENVAPFAGFTAYPNPFRGTVTLRYLLPAEAARVEYALYDARGRIVWRTDISKGVRTGINTTVWDGRGNGGASLSSGTYLLRARALDAAGRELGCREQKLVYVP